MNAPAQPFRSGFPGSTPRQVRDAMLRNGWGVLPIIAHDAGGKSPGKRPLLTGWQEFAQWDAKPASAGDLAEWDKSAGRAPGTGVPCGDVIGIDLDFRDPALAERFTAFAFEIFGETPFIRQGRAPKVLLVYRAAEPMAKRAFKTLDGIGDGLDIQAAGSQFIAFGIHPDTRRPYQWIGPENPLTAGPDIAPAITAAQIEAFLDRVREVVELSKTGGRKGKAGESAEIVTDADGLVVDGREGWLTRKVHQAAMAMRAAGDELAVEALTARAWEAFAATTKLEDGRWTRADAETKARAWLDRDSRGLIQHGPKIEQAEPSYPDRRKPLDEAQAAVNEAVGAFFAEHARAYVTGKIGHKFALEAALAKGALLLPTEPELVSWALRIETAIGKTTAAITAIAEAARTGLRIVYAVPTHKLGAELVEKFATAGVRARVYRGYEALDPEATSGETMCLDRAAMSDARDGGMSVFDHVCERKLLDGSKARCPFFHQCGMIRQRNATPDVWIVPHALLFQTRPGFILAPDALVIDERFHGNAIPNKAATLTLDAIEHADFMISREDGTAALDESNDLESYRATLVRALRAAPDGPLDRESLRAAHMTAEKARAAHKLEWKRKQTPEVFPGMDPAERGRLAAKAAPHNKEVAAIAGVWREIADFLEADVPQSGRLRLVFHPETKTRTIERRSLSTIDKLWQAPALILDATAPDPAILSAVVGHQVELKASIAAQWSPNGKVRQIIGAPVSATKLGIRDGQNEAAGQRNRAELRRLIGLRAALAFPRVVAVVGQKELIERLAAAGLPSNVEVGHFCALAGLDKWKDAAGLICIGRILPTVFDMEAEAGVITGVPAMATASENGGRSRWYERVAGGIRLADGPAVAVETYRHPDPIADALRWQWCEGELIQAVGRLRALRRDAGNPYFLDIICDVPLPLTVDRVETWESVCPDRWADMAGGGVILTSPADVMAAYPELAQTRDQAKALCNLTMGGTSINYRIIDVPPIVAWTYKPAGRRPPAKALVLPNGPQEPETLKLWLEARTGPIEWVRIEGEAGGEVQADTKAAA